jgi:predicted dehydrogenase
MTSASRPLRFGLVGTGYWARVTHAPALATTDGIELTAIFGRDRQATADLAATYHATPHHEEAAFLAGVDAVAFSVPPHVQAPFAARAARAGKHLLLEKPIALAEADADGLVDAVDQAGVASVVFFIHRFHPDVRAWLANVNARGGWAGAVAVWLGTAMNSTSPYNSAWRREKGGLWDVGPHLVSLLWASLGPVTSLLADAGPVDVTHLILHHQGGASSAVTVTLSAAEKTKPPETYLWGASGRSVAPIGHPHPVTQMRTALAELAANARSGLTSHPCDVRFGRDVGRVLAEAQRQIDARPVASPVLLWHDE